MKKILLFIIFILNFQTLAKANDIRDFEIEGISIGDSALSFFKKKQIDDAKSFYPGNDNFFRVSLKYQSESFERIQLHIKNNDPTYKIYGLSGLIFYKDRNTSETNCLKKHKEITKSLSQMLKDLKTTKLKKVAIEHDKTGNSFHHTIYFDFNDEQTEFIKIGCVIYGDEYFKKEGFYDHLRLGFQTVEFSKWMKNGAF